LYNKYQKTKAVKEPFNKELLYIRDDYQIYTLLDSIFKQYENDPRVIEVRTYWEDDEPMKQYRTRSRRVEKTNINVFRYEIDIWIVKEDTTEDIKNKALAKSRRRKKSEKNKEYVFRKVFDRHSNIKIKYDESKYKKYTVYGKLFMPKLVNNLFYLIEGSRYFTRMQIVDKIVYPVDQNHNKKIKAVNYKNERSGERSLSLTTRLPKMQLSMSNSLIYEFTDMDTDEAYFAPYFNLLLFNKNQNIIQILLTMYAFNMIVEEFGLNEPTSNISITDVYDDENRLISRGHRNLRDTYDSMLQELNTFLGTNVVVTDEDYSVEGYLNLRLQYKEFLGPYVKVEKEEFENNVLTKTLISGLQKMFESYCEILTFRETDNLNKMDKRSLEELGGSKITVKELENSRIDEVGFKYHTIDEQKVVLNEDIFRNPALLVHMFGGIIFKKNDYVERLNRTFLMFLSMERLNDENLLDEYVIDKDEDPNLMTFLKFLIVNFNEIKKSNTSNLYNKRIRVSENVIAPIRVLTSQVLFALVKENYLDYDRVRQIFNPVVSNKNMLIKDILKNDLILYDNSTNDSITNHFTSLKYTLAGNGGLNSKRIPFKYRRIDPSYLGNLSLVSSSATNPGITGTIIPFAKIILNEKTSSFEFHRSNNN
jgi:hypothetical protein